MLRRHVAGGTIMMGLLSGSDPSTWTVFSDVTMCLLLYLSWWYPSHLPPHPPSRFQRMCHSSVGRVGVSLVIGQQKRRRRSC